MEILTNNMIKLIWQVKVSLCEYNLVLALRVCVIMLKDLLASDLQLSDSTVKL